MRRPTAFSTLKNSLKLGSASLFALVAILACSDNTAPAGLAELDPASIQLMYVPDSIKAYYFASMPQANLSVGPSMTAPARVSANVIASGNSCSAGGSEAGYNKSRIDFAPEADAVNAIAFPRDADDGLVEGVPIGFDFNYYGNTYNKLNLYLNGFVTFGVPVAKPFWATDGIPIAAAPDNMIAIAWNDWFPGKVAGSVRFETRGTAPKRKFILQFRGVPESLGAGKLTAMLVLSEGSNVVEIHTSNMNMTNGGHRMTQGVENSAGTVAVFDSALTPAGLITPRVRGFFSLSNDAVRFAPLSSKDEVAPTIPELANLEANNDPGLASAVVAVAPPAASDNCDGAVTLSSVRSDGVSDINAPYPVGVTTITWTAKDGEGNSSSASQTVTVFDKEAPVFAANSPSFIQRNATSPKGANVEFALSATDNVAVISLVCEPASGSLFAAGAPVSVSCTAKDAAGNHSSHDFSVQVIDAHQQLFNLLQYVIDLELPNGTAQPIINQLSAAYDNQGVACKKIGDFMSMVQKKESNIPSDEAKFILGEATRIMSAMGCPPPKRADITVSASFSRIR